MEKLFLILAGLSISVMLRGQSLNMDDLVNLSSLSSKNFDNYIEKKGFSAKRRSLIQDCMGFTFFETRKASKPDSEPILRTVDLYKKDDTWCIAFHTSSKEEYADGRSHLKTMNFFSGTKDSSLANSLLFQKKTVTAEASFSEEEDGPVYTFLFTRKDLPRPGKVRNAEDLLQFGSHEYLVSFFGEKNVRKDVYYLSETETRNCSVVMPNSNQQVVFIWEDEANFRKILFIQISGAISASSTARYNGGISLNTWTLRNGIYAGMLLKDLVELNDNDFEFFGEDSEYSLMVNPKTTGNVNFKHIGIKLTCFNCEGSGLMKKPSVSAEDAVANKLALHVSSIMISP